MNYQRISRKAKLICFLMIFSVLISVAFPLVATSENGKVEVESEIEFLINSDTEITNQFQENSKIDFSTDSNLEIFPKFTKYKKNPFQKYLEKLKFSIETDPVGCSEELTVYLDKKPLFCVQDTTGEVSNTTEKLPYENEEIMVFDASRFSKNIKKFANNRNIQKELTIKPLDCETKDNKNCLIESSERKKYYYIPIGYDSNLDLYFNQKYFTEIIKIGRKSDSSMDREWKENANKWKKIRNKVEKKIQIAINQHRKEEKDKEEQKKEEKDKEEKDKEEQAKLKLSKQAVRIRGKEPIFYIRTWNNGLSPSERAQRVSDKITKIIEGNIDIQGLGIFEKPIENTDDEQSTNDTPKVIKVISDSKFLTEAKKEIIELTHYDALFEGKDNVADLAQEYLIEITKFVDEYKKNPLHSDHRGYPVIFLDKRRPLFYISSGLGSLKNSNLFQSSHRASNISKRIEKFAQKNSLLNPDRLVVAYHVAKGLCILPESLKEKDYKKYLAKNNPDKRDENNCKIEELVRNKNLQVVYSNEITRKINKADWQLTNSRTTRDIFDESSKYLHQELPQAIIFMELNKKMKLGQKDELLIDVQFTELDPILHEKYKTIQELAIYFRDQVEEKVNAYISRKRIWLVIFTALLLAILQLNFKKPYLFLEEKAKISIVCKLLLFITTLVLILSNIPKLDFFLNDLTKKTSRFLVDRINIIWSYISTEIPKIIFILVCAFFLDYIITQCASKIKNNILEKEENKLEKEENKTLVKSILTIIRIFLVIFTIIFISPHLPAAGTIYFKGISAFIVLAFTWSASSIISDLASGLILIFSRSLKITDWIEIEDTIGQVTEQNLFFHKIKTLKHSIKTIPNSVILSKCTTNLTISCEEDKSKLILHTPVGLGYDVPRKLVEDTLIKAAFKTKNVLQDKKDKDNLPFVLIKSLGDFAITYELNVCTDKPELIAKIYSELQENILDECESRGIEILSPNYLTLRYDTK